MVHAENERVCLIAWNKYNILKSNVWSSIYSNEKFVIDGENDTRFACGLIEP